MLNMVGRKEQIRRDNLKLHYPNSFTDDGKYISKRMKKKMTAASNDIYKKELIKKKIIGSQVWNSKFGRDLLK